MSNFRKARIEEAYQKEILNIITYSVRDPRLRGVSITQVVFTPDLRLAKIYYDVPEGRDRIIEINKGFAKSKGFIKKALSQKVKIKYMPDIKFYFDETAQVKDNIDQLFDEIKRKENAPGNEN
ncbi:MAG: 30S ribosome-binding factor RbfA [bacterium]|nr:30S ribosome-binding factor RbfA [bacterium]MBU1916708.1 30S ribosome-binding factor RbfA [bacterium]